MIELAGLTQSIRLLCLIVVIWLGAHHILAGRRAKATMKLLSPKKHFVAAECQGLHRGFLREQQYFYRLGLPRAGMNHSFYKSM